MTMRRATVFAAIVLTLALPLAAFAQDVAMQPTLEELRYNARPLVIFADTPEDPKFVQQMELLEVRPEELEKRRVVVLVDTDPQTNGPLRQQLRPQGFGLVLIDVDGAVAHRRPLPTSVRELSNFIDRMPSRRQETGSQRP
jgi:hypothetical protein